MRFSLKDKIEIGYENMDKKIALLGRRAWVTLIARAGLNRYQVSTKKPSFPLGWIVRTTGAR
jgi:hypothetical protein